MAAAAIALYFAAMLLIGWLAQRRAAAGAAEWYLASRALSTVALFFALFGTNCSPFVLMGIPGQAYHDGLAVFSLNAPIIALGIPLTFWWFGRPARAMGERLGALTPAELVARRLDSRAVGIALFVVFTAFTLPYMVTGVQGCGLALAQQFPETFDRRGGAALSLAVALGYTLMGGMRATAWTNIVQGALFLGVVVAAIVPVIAELGGPAAAFRRLVTERPDLALLDPGKPRFAPRAFASWGLAITLTVICFPHMLVRLMAAKGDATLRATCRLYPLALVALWTPAVLLGTLGALLVPGLAGSASDAIFPRLSARIGDGFATCGTLAVLAAAMSTLDAQLLTLGSMASRDLLGRRVESGGSAVGVERWFLFGAGFVVFALHEAVERFSLPIFDVAAFSFSGYVTLFPTLALTLLWRRFTATAALTSMAAGLVTLAAAQAGWLDSRGFLPVAPALVAAALVAFLASWFTRPPSPAQIAHAFGDRER